jgi:hypothetical protein
MVAKDGNAAVANARKVTSYPQGYCLKWVRECWLIGSFYASAIDAWNGAKYKHPGDRNPPKGAAMYYSGGKYGHIVIAVGEPGGRMRSTDCTSATRVNDADINWPVNAWGDKYLGWSSDLNGVDLPLQAQTPDGGDDDMPQYDHGATTKAQTLKAGEWVGITWASEAGADAFKPGSTVISLGGRRYTASVHATIEAPQGSTIRMRIVEIQGNEVVESGPQVEFTATSGTSYPEHAAVGNVAEGRTLRARVLCTQDATLTAADAVFLSW